jgi:hypothetical protein
MACFKGEGKRIHSSTVKALYARILKRITVFNFLGLSGQLVSGTMILIEDSNNTWKVDDLKHI